MPGKNRVKLYIENGFYHVYNRGVEKRNIFLDDQDYRVFLHLLKRCLSPSLKEQASHPLTEVADWKFIRPTPFQSLCGKAELLAYVLMPNHFHLLLKQITKDGMTKLLHKVCAMYVRYFNRKQERVGHLFQEIYKAVMLEKDSHFLHLTRYFHFSNPSEITGSDIAQIREYPYSSYGYYLGNKRADWIHSEYILEFFKSTQDLSFKDTASYQDFVEENTEDPGDVIPDFLIDID